MYSLFVLSTRTFQTVETFSESRFRSRSRSLLCDGVNDCCQIPSVNSVIVEVMFLLKIKMSKGLGKEFQSSGSNIYSISRRSLTPGRSTRRTGIRRLQTKLISDGGGVSNEKNKTKQNNNNN